MTSAESHVPQYGLLNEVEIPLNIMESWQVTVNLLAEIAGIPAALVMRAHTDEIEVFVASQSPDNVFRPGEKSPLNIGLYCETVMTTRRNLLVPNALKDPNWVHNPDIKQGMIAYCGLPLNWPNGEVFGTICVLDAKENQGLQKVHDLMQRFRDSIELSLESIYQANVSSHQQQAAESKLLESEALFHAVFDNAAIGIAQISISGHFLQINREFCRIIGYSQQEVLAEEFTFQQITFPEDLELDMANVERLLSGDGDNYVMEKRYIRKDGHTIWVNLSVQLQRSYAGEPLYFISVAEDISERKYSQQRIWHQANYDQLTNLPKRALFFDRLSKEIAQARRNHVKLAVLFLDLDGFKGANDQYGHDAGDLVLKSVVKRWKACLRDIDTIARMGGDEFAVIVAGLETQELAAPIAEKLIAALTAKISLSNRQECLIGVSVGIAIYPDNATEMDSLLSAADTAMYESKSCGKNTFRFSSATSSINSQQGGEWFRFDDDHLVGYREIDEQHRHLIRLINQLNHEVTHQYESKDIDHIFNALIDYTVVHFETEHQLMTDFDYPDMKMHAQEHGALLKEVQELSKQFRQGNEMLVLQSIKDWLLEHICNSDKPLGEFLRSVD